METFCEHFSAIAFFSVAPKTQKVVAGPLRFEQAQSICLCDPWHLKDQCLLREGRHFKNWNNYSERSVEQARQEMCGFERVEKMKQREHWNTKTKQDQALRQIGRMSKDGYERAGGTGSRGDKGVGRRCKVVQCHLLKRRDLLHC